MKIPDLEKQAPAALAAALEEVPFLSAIDIEGERGDEAGSYRPDLCLRLRTAGGEQLLAIEVKRSGQPRYAREAIAQLKHYIEKELGTYGVFVAPYITERTARVLKEEGVGYVDLAGNCLLAFDQVYVQREGRENPFSEKRELRSLFAPKASRILRVLLANPSRPWKTMTIAEEAGVSTGHVSNVRQLLLDKEWAEEAKVGFHLRDPEAVLGAWAENYDFSKNRVYSFYAMDPIPAIERRLSEMDLGEGHQQVLTSFSGAERRAPHVRYERASAYVQGDIDEVANALGLKKVASGANVELIAPYDAGVFYDADEIEGALVASPIQLYLDLRSRHGRGEEAADFLYRELIKPRWQV